MNSASHRGRCVVGDERADEAADEVRVTVRYWAAARAAAGLDAETLTLAAPATVADVLAAAEAAHPDRERLGGVLAICSVLVGERPVGAQSAAEVAVTDGDTLELLPPFAGG